MRVLISAYACEPGKGSEPGAGWNWSLAAARENDVWVLTRSNNREAIEAELERHPIPSLRFVYLDLPRRWTFWKRGQRGVRLYYSLWQLAALREARRLHLEVGFDVVHHLTFANAWLPAGVAFVDAPCVLGPLDAGLRVPVRFYRELGVRGVLAEWKAEIVRGAARLNPVAQRGMRRAVLVIAQNEESAERLSRRVDIVRIRPNASVDSTKFECAPARDTRTRSRTAVIAGRLVAWKGVALALRAVARTDDWSLEVVGRGPDRKRLGDLAKRLGIGDRVEFVPWLPQEQLWQRMAESAAVLVPSLREAASFTAVEAASLGVRVIALDQGGPRVLSHMSPDSIRVVSRRSAWTAAGEIAHALKEAESLVSKPTDVFSTQVVAADLREIYGAAIRASGPRAESPRSSAPVGGPTTETR